MLFRISASLIAMASWFASASAFAGTTAKQQVSTRQLMEISRAVTGMQKVSIPLLIALDDKGRIIAHQKEWDESAVSRLIDLASTTEGTRDRFAVVLDTAGLALDDTSGRPTIVALSVPSACKPCASMEHILEAAAAETDRVFVTVLFSSPTIASPTR